MSAGSPMKISNAFQIGLLGGLGVLTALLIGNAVVTIANLLTYVLAAIFIALGLDPVVSFLESKKIKRGFAIPIVVVGLLTLLGALAALLAPTLISQSAHFIEIAPTVLTNIQHSDWLVSIDAQFNGGISKALDSGVAFLSNSQNWPSLLGGVVQVGISVFNGLSAGFIITVLSLYFMASLHSFQRFLYSLVSASRREQFTDITVQISSSVGRYVTGQLTIAFFNAAFGLVFMSIAQVPFPLVLASIGFVLALIPLVGSLSGMILNSLVALTVSPVLGLITFLYYLIYTQIEAYVISPRIMNKAIAVPGAVVVVAALAGGALLGILGALVAIPAAASVILIIRQVWVPRQDAR